MAKFRKKPVVIEAWQYRPARNHLPSWLRDALYDGSVWEQGGETPYMTIKTLEGEMRASSGDWIIKGVKNEIYPCKPDIFEATYESAE
ncbi:MAG TPA: hypothetical protein VF901_21935 [Bradyrhizobium sp.]